MATVTIHEAKTQLSRLIARVEAGEEIIIARGKQPVARLAPLAREAPEGRRRGVHGMLRGKVAPLPDSFFFDPLPEDEQRLWEGDDEEPR